MKANDFNLSHDMKFDFDKGLRTFQNARLVIFDAEAMGSLRQKMIEEEGMEKARSFFLQFGYKHGWNDYLRMRNHYPFDNEMEALGAGPVIHTWEGIVNAKIKELQFDRARGEMLFTGIWTNSWEAEQHLAYNGPSGTPVCWSLMGYASGWSSAFFGAKVICIEPLCMGKGDAHCEWKIQPPAAWGEEATPYLRALENY